MTTPRYDLLIIGSGPAGQKAAIAAAKIGKQVAVIDRRDMLGGGSLHGGTIPSKTLREAILFLSGFRQRPFYGKDFSVKDDISSADLQQRIVTVVQRETEVVKSQLGRNGVDTVNGLARFLDPHTLEVEGLDGQLQLQANHILVACGSRPARDPSIPFDGQRIFDSDELLRISELPREIIVVGGGVIGLEYASMFTALRIETTIIDQRPEVLEFLDEEIVDRLRHHMRDRGAVFRLGEKVVSIEMDEKKRVVAHLESGKHVRGNSLLYAIGRQSNADTLNAAAAGLQLDERGRLTVNEFFQTSVPHIYAAGDVIGFPALAATSMQQGRKATCHMFNVASEDRELPFPFGVYTVPEISMIGRTEKELTRERIPYEFGCARYDELAKGQIVGDQIGFLKILFDPTSLNVLGVHAMGENAAELIHIGQAVMSLGGTMHYFRDAVFNYPTFAEAYKVAALDGFNKL